ncbi:MAG: hypothetical protein RBT20_01785 [Syntrophales bacterium]|nr:hypothetical protein [Syntrophales bacterium]
MKGKCPYCRHEVELMEIFHESDTTAVIQMLPAFGKHSHIVMEYCYLFGVSPWRLKAHKLRVVLSELKALFDSESFHYQKRIYRISQAGIVEALNVVIHRNFTDCLDSHNYLKKIMIGIAEREEKETGRQAERELRKKEAGLMVGSQDHGEGRGSTSFSPLRMKEIPPTHLTEEQIETNRRRLREMMDKIG